MKKPGIIKFFATAVALVLVLAACQQGGISSADADEIRLEIQEINSRLDSIEGSVEQHAAESENGEELVAEVQQELTQARDTLAQVEDRLAPPPPPQDDFADPAGMPGGF